MEDKYLNLFSEYHNKITENRIENIKITLNHIEDLRNKCPNEIE